MYKSLPAKSSLDLRISSISGLTCISSGNRFKPFAANGHRENVPAQCMRHLLVQESSSSARYTSIHVPIVVAIALCPE